MKAQIMIVTLAAAALALAAACGDSDDAPGSTGTPTATPGPTPTLATADIAPLRAAATGLMDAIVSGDPDAIRASLPTDLLDETPDEEIEALASCRREGAEVSIGLGPISILGDSATVTAVWTVTVGERRDTGERVWNYERQADGEWEIVALPECPVQAVAP